VTFTSLGWIPDSVHFQTAFISGQRSFPGNVHFRATFISGQGISSLTSNDGWVPQAQIGSMAKV
jgi:hypothetical protein